MTKHFILLFFISLIIGSCDLISSKKNQELSMFTPDFNNEQTYSYIEEQLKFGPRIPESKAHQLCQSFIQKHFMKQGFHVTSSQSIKQGGKGLITINNIVASYKSENPKKKILLATHYDTRYLSNDSVPDFIPGANDGASGTAVLMELANIIKKDSLPFDIDFIFFDGQDQGHDSYIKTWCLGAQKWAKSNKTSYDFGIVLDMVGAKDATFAKETFSSYFCKELQDKVWEIGSELGYESYFPENNTVEQLINDHYFINNLTKSKSPTLLLTDYRSEKESYFPQWHLKTDDLNHIDKSTLKVIGQTLVELLYLPEN